MLSAPRISTAPKRWVEARKQDRAHKIAVPLAPSNTASDSTPLQAGHTIMFLSRWGPHWRHSRFEHMNAGLMGDIAVDDLVDMLGLVEKMLQFLHAKLSPKLSGWRGRTRATLAEALQAGVEGPLDAVAAYQRACKHMFQSHMSAEATADSLINAVSSIMEKYSAFQDYVIKLHTATLGDISTLRTAFLERYCRLGHAFALMVHASPFASSTFSEAALPHVVDFSKQVASFSAWVQAARGEFAAMAADWNLVINVESESQGVLDFARKAFDATVAAWNSQLNKVAADLQALGPTNAMMQSARLVSDVDMRQALKAKAAAVHSSPLLAQSREVVAAVKKFEQELPVLKKMSGYVAVTHARRLARLAIALNWALDEVLNFEPKDHKDLAEKSKLVQKKLLGKGIGGKDCLIFLRLSW